MPLFARAYLDWNNQMSKILYDNKNIEVSYLGVIFRFHEGSVEINSFATVCEISSGWTASSLLFFFAKYSTRNPCT